MDTNCHYHPTDFASWQCQACDKNTCNSCTPAGHSEHWGIKGPKCVMCNRSLEYLGSATGAKPFWQAVPNFMLYPLQLNVLLLIVLMAGASKFMGMGLMSLFVGLFMAAVLVKYGFAIIEARGMGETRAPGVAAVIEGDSDHLFLKQIAVLLVMGVVSGLAFRMGELVGLAASLFMTLALPASMILLAVGKSVRRAVSPTALISMMLTIGLPYLLLWFCVQLISSGPVYAMEPMAELLPEGWIIPALVAMSLYFSIVTYCMLGYVLFQYQHELGYVQPGCEGEDISDADFIRDRALAEVTILVHEQQYEQARNLLRAALDQVKDERQLHEKYHRLLMLLEDETSLKNHANYYVDLLLRFAQVGKSADIFLDVQNRIADFQLNNLQHACRVAEMLQSQGKPKQLVRSLLNIHKQHTGDPELPRAYLLVARTLMESLGQDAKAEQLLRFLVKQYPSSPYLPEVKELLGQLQAVS